MGTRANACEQVRTRCGAQGRSRTTDTAIFSRMLYQLSYLGAGPANRSDGRGYRGWWGACPHLSAAILSAARQQMKARVRASLALAWAPLARRGLCRWERSSVMV